MLTACVVVPRHTQQVQQLVWGHSRLPAAGQMVDADAWQARCTRALDSWAAPVKQHMHIFS